jgi:ubiquinone/menaquinone biosynthesis C-methylase UbiE
LIEEKAMGDSSVIIEAFTELAPRYEETMDRELGEFLGLGYREFVDRLIEAASIEEGDVVLDVATGTALIPLRLADKVGARGRAVGLDITPAMLNHGRKNIEATGSSSCISLVCASGMAMPFVEGAFSVVMCGFGTHHMDVPQLLSEMRRVLKVRGKLIVAAAGVSSFWRSFLWIALLKVLLIGYGLTQKGARVQAEVEAIPNFRTADEWHTILSDSGFARIEMSKSRARRPWYPYALTVRAVAGDDSKAYR